MSTSTLKFQAENIQFIEFELSNQCQYTGIHDWCPRNKLGCSPKIELSTSVIEKTVEFFKTYNFSGSVYFSIYNEPLLDPRIYDLIKYVKSNLTCTVQMFTNGVLLNDDVASKLKGAGVDILRVSIYDPLIRSRFQQDLEQKYDLKLVDRLMLSPKNDMGYDDRISIYDRKLDCKEPCYMPIQYFLINCNGEVMMCWDDWKSQVIFGNIYTDDIGDILICSKRLDLIDQLKSGNRIGVCVGCDRPTEMCISEYRGRLKL